LLSAVRAGYEGLAQRAILYPVNDLPDAVQEEIFSVPGGSVLGHAAHQTQRADVSSGRRAR
jgi:hypothetical protein